MLSTPTGARCCRASLHAGLSAIPSIMAAGTGVHGFGFMAYLWRTILLCAGVAACGGAWLRAACPERDHLFGEGVRYDLSAPGDEDLPFPHVVVAADFDGDGILDLASLNRGTGTVAIFTGRGDGSFATPPVLLALTDAPGSVYEGMCAADLNGNGRPDLAAVDWMRAELTLLLSDGAGGFAAPVRHVIAAADAAATPHAVVAADVDNDGDLDLVVTCDLAAAVAIFKNDGAGNFTQWRNFPTAGVRPQTTAVADFDGDGFVDYVVANSGWVSPGQPNVGSITVFRNRGDGAAEYRATIAVSDRAAPLSAVPADLDLDGHTDVVVGSWTDNQLMILWGDGEGSFAGPDVHFTPAGSTAVEPAVADVDADGLPDIVVALYESPHVMIFWGTGERGFAAGPVLKADAKPRYVTAADFDQDGDMDIASVQWGGGTLRVYENMCVGPQPFVRGDANADGAANVADAIFILAHLFAGQAAPSCAQAADVNDDGGVNVADAVYLLAYLFAGGHAPPAPFGACGSAAPTGGGVGCASFAPCD